jgi:hypothetical protein
MNKAALEKLKRLASPLEKDAGSAKTPADAQRLRALGKILEHPAA